MKNESRDELLAQLNWRYAVKQFDPARKIGPADWETLEQALVLSPSSAGLQPWKFIVVTDPEVRAKLLEFSWGQAKVAEASHLVVFTAKTSFTEEDVDAHLKRVAEVQGVPLESLEPLRQMMIGGIIQAMDPEARIAWARRQVYIALGVFLTSAAVLGIDACPMEGFLGAEYDRILGLEAQGLTAAVIATVGYRSPEDKYATMPKVRFPREEVVVHV